MILILPYRGSSDECVNILQSFVDINLDLLSLENKAYLATKQLTEEELQSSDFLSGFQLIDIEMRFFVIEGQPRALH
jgi:hypothetical protein